MIFRLGHPFNQIQHVYARSFNDTNETYYMYMVEFVNNHNVITMHSK